MNNFTTFQNYIKSLKTIYSNALDTFNVWESLRELSAPNLIGEEEATQNVNCMNHLKGFFTPVQCALLKFSLLELAKLFDNARESIHISKLINFSSAIKMTVDDFQEYNQDREFIEEMINNWEGINKEDIREIKELIEYNKPIIDKLITYRDEVLAHNDKQKTEVKITIEEIHILFKIIGKILNIFSNKTNRTTTWFELTEQECKEDTAKLIRILRKAEVQRLEEVKQKINEMRRNSPLTPLAPTKNNSINSN